MKVRLVRINLYLLLITTLWWVGCKTTEERQHAKEASTFRLYLEGPREGGSNQRSGVAVYRQSPVYVNVEREPFLNEGDVDSASVVDMPGGYAIQVQFNGHGALVLEGATVAHKGQRLVARSDFGESRWLAAPLITRRISNGLFVFTPDATREESERIVRGLNNLVAKIKKKTSGF